jgi:sugar-specific transcriptional regulator TrmB
METEALEELGLTRNESIVYITLLDLGKAHIGQISEKTRMHRRTIYDCLERLQDRGLVSHIIEGKTRFFIAINPKKLKEIIEYKKAKIDNILPKLFEIAKSSKVKTEVLVNKGKEGLKNILEDVLRTKPKILYSLTSAGKVTEVLPFYILHFHEKRAKLNIKLDIIFGKNDRAIKRAKELKKLKLTEVKFIDSKYVAPISIWMYNNKLAFLIWASEIGILIENKETTDTFKNYFNLLWKLAKK